MKEKKRTFKCRLMSRNPIRTNRVFHGKLRTFIISIAVFPVAPSNNKTDIDATPQGENAVLPGCIAD